MLKAVTTMALLLAMGAGLTLAAESSEPGMFLYPLKQTSHRVTDGLGDSGGDERATIQAAPAVDMAEDPASEAAEDDATPGPDLSRPSSPSSPDTPTATPVPTLARVVDEIMPSIEPSPTPSQEGDRILPTLAQSDQAASQQGDHQSQDSSAEQGDHDSAAEQKDGDSDDHQSDDDGHSQKDDENREGD